MYTIVEFPSQGVTLRGRYYLPESVSHPLPIVIMAHGFTSTINGMVADRYAEVLCEAGLAVLLYDHRNFGISDGEPRQEFNQWIQARGYLDAIDFVMTHPEEDTNRVAIWGDSASGAEAMIAGAVDERIQADAVQNPACGRKPPPPDLDGTLFETLR
jgi:cephalosporin-C deacetylase-like acetyl esterase